jgi:hypothetical protein
MKSVRGSWKGSLFGVASGLLTGLPCLACSQRETPSVSKATTSASAIASARRPAPPGPETVSFHSMPVGSWSEYETRAAGMSLRQVVALVERAKDGSSFIETSVRDGAGSRSRPVVTRDVFGPTGRAGDAPLARAVQVEGHDPMNYPLTEGQPAGEQGLNAFGPQTFAGSERISVPAGTFDARKYVVRSADGAASTLWLDQNVFPTGIVKLLSVSASGDPAESSVMELVQKGDGAVPKIVKPLLTWNPDAHRRQMMSGLIGPEPLE